MNIIDTLVTEKIADDSYHAANMLMSLSCTTLSTDGARIERCKLYKAWKQTGENKAEARRKAIAGEQPPVGLWGMR